MQLQELGALLKSERERQGFSISEMMERTKISRANLVALEEGDDGHLPHPVYVKGFVRNYARELGLGDHEALARGLNMEIPEQEPPATNRGDTDMGHLDDVASRSLPVLPFVLAVLVGLGVAAYLLLGPGGRYEYLLQPGADQAQEQIPGQASQEMSESAADAQQEPAAEPMPESASEMPPASAPEAAPEPEAGETAQELAQEAAPETVQGADAPAVETPAPAAPAAPGDETAPEPEVPAMRVAVITATAECWTYARAGDGRERTRVLQPGQSMTMEFKESLTVRLGNSGGVDITLDGQPFAFNGAPGQVRTVRLP